MPAKRSFKGQRFSRERAKLYIAKLDHWLFSNWLGANDKIFYGGSWARGCEEIGDIDVAICFDGVDHPITKESVELPKMFRNDWEVETLSSGVKLARHVVDFSPIFAAAPSLEYKFQLDLWFIDNPNQWGPLCMFVAGSGRFNMHQRVLASKQGYVLNQYTVLKDGESMGSFPTEVSVYQFFKWPFVPYSRRNWG